MTTGGSGAAPQPIQYVQYGSAVAPYPPNMQQQQMQHATPMTQSAYHSGSMGGTSAALAADGLNSRPLSRQLHQDASFATPIDVGIRNQNPLPNTSHHQSAYTDGEFDAGTVSRLQQFQQQMMADKFTTTTL